MSECPSCGGPTERPWRYCPWCARPQRVKLVEFFRAHPLLGSGQGKALRVSRYLGDEEAERHVRFSVWQEQGDRAAAESAISLDEGEAGRLVRFLADRPSEGADPDAITTEMPHLRR